MPFVQWCFVITALHLPLITPLPLMREGTAHSQFTCRGVVEVLQLDLIRPVDFVPCTYENGIILYYLSYHSHSFQCRCILPCFIFLTYRESLSEQSKTLKHRKSKRLLLSGTWCCFVLTPPCLCDPCVLQLKSFTGIKYVPPRVVVSRGAESSQDEIRRLKTR